MSIEVRINTLLIGLLIAIEVRFRLAQVSRIYPIVFIATVRHSMSSREAGQLAATQAVLTNILLQPQGAGVVESVDAWESMATSQQVPNSNMLSDCTQGSVFALEDRNMFAMPWRKIFIVRDEHDYVLYDSDGWLINEPSYGVAQGRQAVNELVSEFTSEHPFMYYRPPIIRKGPTSRRTSISSATSEETDRAIAAKPTAEETSDSITSKPTGSSDYDDPKSPGEQEGISLPEPASNSTRAAELATETGEKTMPADGETAVGTQMTPLYTPQRSLLYSCMIAERIRRRHGCCRRCRLLVL